MIRKLAIGLAASMALTVSAEAAMVQALEGPIFVDNGQGYQAISGAMQIAPGNLVLAGNGGKAQILYENAVVSRWTPDRRLPSPTRLRNASGEAGGLSAPPRSAASPPA
jgi:hypothetical protein